MTIEIILGVTGGIAAYKSAELVRRLADVGVSSHVMMTQNACRFVTPLTFRALSANPVITDEDDGGDPMPHINLPKKCALIVVAPATANVIGKFANGVADDVLTTTLAAGTIPVLLAPAMNTEMYAEASVQLNIKTLKERGVHFIGPDKGELACGDSGEGKMATVSDIVASVNGILDIKRDLKNVNVIITAGGTREPIDAVRYIGNRSSGKMGVALATAANRRGANVTLIAAHMEVAQPDDISTINVSTADEMRSALLGKYPGCDMVIMAAAVGDYRAEAKVDGKVKKRDRWEIALTRNDDILAELGSNKGEKFLVGFAAETDDPEDNGKTKLISKNLDMIVVNDVSRSDIGFASDDNEVSILARDDMAPTRVEKAPKEDIANAILDRAAKMVKKSK